MTDVLPLLLALLVGAVAGALVARALLRRDTASSPSGAQDVAKAMVDLSHDIRGALSPSLLMAEQLESNSDPGVRKAAGIISQAIDRASERAKAGSTLAKTYLKGP